ncbi:MAG: hypothetical protein KKA42_06300, partial [candidate division Zixibacteria bacterium]|nr:hypothetical protein [candidate division Zixibacteria bacterium]
MRAANAIALIVVFFLVVIAGSVLATGVDLTPRSDKPTDMGQPVPPDPNVTKQGGDNIATATVIPAIPYTNTGTTAGYTDDYDEVCPYTGSTAPDVVYAYTSPVEQWIDVSLCNSSYDTKAYVYENTVGVVVGCNDDACGDDGYKSQITSVHLQAGQTYYIVVDGYGTNSGDYIIDVTFGDPPPSCGDESIFSQLPRSASESWAASVSDLHFTDNELLIYDNFGGLSAPITSMSFWGLGAYRETDWTECFENPTALLIKFYQDNAGAPGAEVASFPMAVTPISTPFLYSGFTLNRYEVTLPSPVALTAGWVSIQGTENPDCWFLWMNSTDVYDYSHYEWDGTTLVADSIDYSLCLNGSACTWNPGDDHKMHYPQLPDELGWDVNATAPVLLADDWLCSETGWVKDFHFWGSWKDGNTGIIEQFELAIYADIPDPDGTGPAYSQPGELLWRQSIVSWDEVLIQPGLMEGWLDPVNGDTLFNNHDEYFQYNICVPEGDWFMQTEGTVYWLCVSARVADPVGTHWGWKSTVDHWNDDAVYLGATCVAPDNGTGTPTLPPPCPYVAPEEPMLIIDGLPPGTTIELVPVLENFLCTNTGLCSGALPPGECEGVGGSLGGNFQCFEATLDLVVAGTGDLAGFNRHLSVPMFCEVHTAPRTPGDPIQVFDQAMFRYNGELFGDPDFDVFSIVGGNDYGLPSPGEARLTKLPDGDFAVESFFDITYQINFAGAPGSQLEGLAGSTTATIRMQTESNTWTELYEPGDADTVSNPFYITVDPTGTPIDGGGGGFFGTGWYFYPTYDWWNIWFYDHPFDVERYKTFHIEFDAFPFEGGPSFLEVAINWSTDQWSLDQLPGDSAPPLPGVNEDLYIGRYTVLLTEQPDGHYSFDWVFPDYNPEWVSVDLRGFNFIIPAGIITHACTARRGPSLDLSFVITGEPPTGACCDSVGNCTVLTLADCVASGGHYRGDGTVCDPDPCGAIGACCTDLGVCSEITQEHCEFTGRTYKGDGIPCDPDPCDTSCCIGTVGNVQLVPNCDPTDQTVDIGDLTNL